MIVDDLIELEASHIYQTYSKKSLSFSKRLACCYSPESRNKLDRTKVLKKIKNHFDQTKNKNLWFKLSASK